MMRVFVAGATGALGVPVVRALVAEGHHVVGLTRSPAKRAMLEALGAVPAVADALDAAAIARAVRDAAPTHAVNLLTALPRNGPVLRSHMEPTLRLKTDGTRHLLDACIAAGVKRIVAESIIFAYGYGRWERPIVESDAPSGPNSVPWLQEIVAAMRSLEDQQLAANAAGRIEAISLRFGLFYGAASGSTEFAMKMLRLRARPVIRGADAGVASFIHIDDAATATLAALQHGRAGEIYNVVDDDPISMNEWFRRAAAASGARAPWRLPHWIARRAMPYATAILAARLPVSNAKAKAELGWAPRYPSTREGLRQVVEASAGGPHPAA